MSTITRFRGRDPFFAEFDSLVRSTFGGQTVPSGESLAFTPTAETVREGDDVVVRLDLPGVDVAEDVSVEVTNNRLVIAGERKDDRAEESTGRSVREVRYGSFRRSFGLPGHVGADAVSAHYDKGVLHVRVAGVYAGTEPTRIAISDGPAVAEVEQA